MNSAQRILLVYGRLVALQGSSSARMNRIWPVVFGGRENVADKTTEDEVLNYLQALRAEIDQMQAQLAEIGVPKGLYEACVAALRSATSAGQWEQQFQGVLGSISPPQYRIVLEWAAWTLREHGESDIPEEVLKALSDEIGALEESLRAAKLSPPLAELIQRRVKALRDALILYPIRGVEPLDEALEHAAGAFKVSEARVRAEVEASPEAASIVKKASGLLTKAAEVSDKVEKVGKGGSRLLTAGKAAWEVLSSVVS